MKHLFSILAVLSTLSVFSTSALPHSGGLDSKGCHTNRKTGDYHCHRPQTPAGETPAPKASPAVKKSNSGICHDRESPYYSRTTNFTAFSTMAECLKSGGRRPK